MRAATLRWLGVIALGAGALAVLLYVASTVDLVPPQVASYQLTQHLPGDDAVALTTTSIEVRFSEPVEHSAAEGAFEIEPPIAGTFTWSSTTMVFTPQERLPLETEFAVRVQPGVRDLAGNEMQAPAGAFEFVTVGRPAVVAADPADGADEVPVDATITLTFSTLMDTGSIQQALSLEPRTGHRLQWNGEQLAIIPDRPLRPGQSYRLEIGTSASDHDGVELAEPFSLSFKTVPPGLAATALIPSEGSEGIAITASIGIVFDRPIEAASIDERHFTVTPEIAGSLELVQPPASLAPDDGARLLRFAPSAPLPPNTTFAVELAPGLRDADGRRLAEPISWTFTTGAPLSTLSNHIVFISDRAGIENLWVMNPDGTGQRQLSVELSPVMDYTVSPDGRTFVVGDGARLVEYSADGTALRLLTDPAHLEFDPAYAPDGTRMAFARADAASGEPLGLWERSSEVADAVPIELPEEPRGGVSPPLEQPTPSPLLRAPVYSPDWSALAFVDVTNGRVGIIELPGGRLTSISFAPLSPPSWRADSTGVVLAGLQRQSGRAERIDAGEPVAPLGWGEQMTLDGATVVALRRGSTTATTLDLGGEIVRAVPGPAGRTAYVVVDGDSEPPAQRLAVSDLGDGTLDPLPDADDVVWVTFGAEPDSLVVERRDAGIWLVRLDSGETSRLAPDGSRPRWLP